MAETRSVSRCSKGDYDSAPVVTEVRICIPAVRLEKNNRRQWNAALRLSTNLWRRAGFHTRRHLDGEILGEVYG
ncbi:MAG: hypothetical protein GTO18_16065 [Anaerolineales bacterium]|nr:hypothetical protein [Anaerolineales bacterium]